MGERIIDYPEAETLANDDYVLLDGLTNGSRRMLASALGQGRKAIASTAQQWLILPFYNDDNPIIKFKMMQPYQINFGLIIGDIWDTSGFVWYSDVNTGYNDFRWGSGNDDLYHIPKKLWKWVDVEIDYGTSKVTVDGTEYTTQTPKTQNHSPIYLFGFTNTNNSCIAIAELKVYVNDALAMKLEPRKDSTTGEGYFYDTVGEQDYYSLSNVPFVYVE